MLTRESTYVFLERAPLLNDAGEHLIHKNNVRIRPWNLRNDVTNRELLGPVNRGSSTRNAVKTPDFHQHAHSAINPPHARAPKGRTPRCNKAKDKKGGETKVSQPREGADIIMVFCEPKGSLTRPTFIQVVNDRSRDLA